MKAGQDFATQAMFVVALKVQFISSKSTALALYSVANWTSVTSLVIILPLPLIISIPDSAQ